MAETKYCPFWGIDASGTTTAVCASTDCKFWDTSTLTGHGDECLIRSSLIRFVEMNPQSAGGEEN